MASGFPSRKIYIEAGIDCQRTGRHARGLGSDPHGGQIGRTFSLVSLVCAIDFTTARFNDGLKSAICDISPCLAWLLVNLGGKIGRISDGKGTACMTNRLQTGYTTI